MTEAGPARKRRRGGVAQRIEQAEEEAKIASQTVELLLERFASGAFSAKECALIAEAVVKDIKAAAAGFNVLHELSQLDKEAKDSTHASRTMNRILETRSVLPEPFVVNMTFTDGQHNTAMLLPHEYFAAYWKQPERRATSLLPDELELPRFWSAVREHPCLQNHPIWARSDALQKCIPLFLHGDEVPVAGIGKIGVALSCASAGSVLCHKLVASTWRAACSTSGVCLKSSQLWTALELWTHSGPSCAGRSQLYGQDNGLATITGVLDLLLGRVKLLWPGPLWRMVIIVFCFSCAVTWTIIRSGCPCLAGQLQIRCAVCAKLS